MKVMQPILQSKNFRKIIFILATVLISAFFISPLARKAVFGGCTGTPNPYCANECCYHTKDVTIVESCSVRDGACRDNTGSMVVECPYDRSVNCQTETYNIGQCDRTTCAFSERTNTGDCCGGGGGDDDDPDDPEDPGDPGGPPRVTPCVAVYNPPTVSLGGYEPPFPIVIGQDPDEVGVDVTAMARGGIKTNSCQGLLVARLTGFTLNGVNLSAASRHWITGELARVYPGAEILDTYPLLPAAEVKLRLGTGTMTLHFDPLDPGTYDFQITVSQQDGQSVTTTLKVPVHLLESSITW
jgi:hypothetical protein